MLTIKNLAGKKLIPFLVAVTLFTACRPAGVRVLLQGQRLLEAGKYQPAIEKLRSATVLLGGTNAQAYNFLGLACHHAGQFADAEKAYERALSLSPDLAEARFNLGCLWLAENKVEQAKGALTAFTLRRGGSAQGWLKLGSAQLRSRELASAEKSYSEAIRIDPQSAEGLTGLGVVRLERGHASDAVQWFAKALKTQPGYRPALLDWAIVAQQNLRDPNLALQKYREYLALKPAPENAESVNVIVRQLELEVAPPPRPAATNVATQPNTIPARSPPPEHATAPVKIAVPEPGRPLSTARVEPATNVPKPSIVTNLAKPTPAPAAAPPLPDSNFQMVKLAPEPVFKAAGDVNPSSTRLEPPPVEKLVATSPPPVVATLPQPVKRSFFQRLNPLNLFNGQDKSPEQKDAPPSQLTSIAPEASTASAAERGTDSAAGLNLPRYVYRAPSRPEPGNHADAEPLFGQGLQSQQGRHYAEAIQSYQRAIAIDPAYFDAYYNLGLAATESGKLPLSLDAYETALAIRPDSVDARYNFALALKQSNYPIDAANELERALAFHPNDARSHLALANLYAQQLGQPAKARLHYLKVLDSDPRNPQAAAVRYWLTANPK